MTRKRGLIVDKLDKLLIEVEREALMLALNKGSWERYWYLKGKADAELEVYIQKNYT